jgi:MFS family permease
MKKEFLDLSLLGVAHSLNHSLFLVLPPLLEQVTHDLGTNYSTIGLISTITFLIYGAGALIGGPLSDKLGSIKVARISIGIGGLITPFFLFANSISLFSVGMFLMAFWASLYHPTVNGLIAKAYPNNTGNAMGIHNAAGNFGQVFTPILAYFLGTTFNWRLSFVFFGLLSVITAWILDKVNLQEEKVEKNETYSLSYLNIPDLWIILIYNIFVGFLFRSVDLFFPSFLSMEKGFTGGLAAASNSLILLVGVAGQMIGGRGSDQFGKTIALIVSSAGMVFSLLFLMVIPTSRFGVLFFIGLYGISMFGHQPITTSLVSSLIPKNMVGFAYGIMFFTAFGVGSLSTTITGYLAEQYNLLTAFWVNSGIAVMLLLISIGIWSKFKEKS